MKLIADSGSTKTDWRLIADHSVLTEFSTMGYNPYFMDAGAISNDLSPQITFITKEQIREVFFYGAGCSENAKKKVIKEGLQTVFSKADIHVESDLLGAARALCGHEPGIAAILGTGSNSCYYNGKKIESNVPSLGFILGDEGSGSYIGKQLIQLYLYHDLPGELQENFYSSYRLGKDEVLNAVYRQPRPNAYLAQFAKFAKQNIEHPFMYDLLFKCFDDFYVKHICKYPQSSLLPVYFTGSIASNFSTILYEVAKLNEAKSVEILGSPIERLVKFHIS